MNDILQQIMNMIENTRTVPSISSFSMIGFTVLLIFGVITCILGYRLLRFWMMLCGFVIGAGIGFGAAYTGGVTEKYMYTFPIPLHDLDLENGLIQNPGYKEIQNK